MTSRYERWAHQGPTGDEAARVQRDIDATMRDVVRYDRVSPAEKLGPPEKVTVANAVRVSNDFRPTGWAPEIPLKSGGSFGALAGRGLRRRGQSPTQRQGKTQRPHRPRRRVRRLKLRRRSLRRKWPWQSNSRLT
jgi:hypothetical protein